MNSGKFTTILQVAMSLASLNPRLSWCLVFLAFYFFPPLGFSGSSGSSFSEGEAGVRDGSSSSEGSAPKSLEPWGSTSTIALKVVGPN